MSFMVIVLAAQGPPKSAEPNRDGADAGDAWASLGAGVGQQRTKPSWLACVKPHADGFCLKSPVILPGGGHLCVACVR